MSTNPYQPPTSSLSVENEANQEELAARSTRFVANLIDSSILLLATLAILGQFASVARIGPELVGVLFSLIASVLMLVINGYPLAKFGQTIGKHLFKLQVVDAQSNKLIPFERICVFRYLWMLPLLIIAAITPTRIDNGIALAAFVVDSLMIFGPQRRCLHDYLAGSKVVLYKDDRDYIASSFEDVNY